MAIITNILLSASVAALFVTVAFLLFARAHERTFPSNHSVRQWGRGRNQ
jgi:hypothetical protein